MPKLSLTLKILKPYYFCKILLTGFYKDILPILLNDFKIYEMFYIVGTTDMIQINESS